MGSSEGCGRRTFERKDHGAVVRLDYETWTCGNNCLRAGAEITSHFGASAGRADARRRDAGDAVSSLRSGNAADARPPPRA